MHPLAVLYNALIGMLTPSEAQAEIVPTDDPARRLLRAGLQAPGKPGETVRALHARPEKTYLSTQPSGLQRVSQMRGDLGLFNPSALSPSYQMYVNLPLHRNLAYEEILKTFGHEAGHGMAQIAGVGGARQPTGYGIVDMLANAFGGRLPKAQNESLADALSGLERPNPATQTLMDAVMQRLQPQQQSQQRETEYIE